MAVFVGKALVVKFGSDTLTHVRSASATSTMGTVDITAAADTAMLNAITIENWEASVDMLADDTTELFDTELKVGNNATLIINPEGVASGAIKLSGNCFVTSFQYSTPYDGVVAVSVNFLGNSAFVVGVNP